MANNRVIAKVQNLVVAATDPATPASGDPLRVGMLTGVALVDEGTGGNDAGYTTADVSDAVYNLSVKGVNDSGNSAVAIGDALFYVDADTPKISKKSSGYFWGLALGTVGSGSTATIEVRHVSGATVPLGAGSVGTADLASGAVTADILGGNLATGFIPLPLTSFRLIASNDIPDSGTPDGGVVSKNTAPILERINAATDKGLRINWATTDVVSVTQSFAYPPDLDDASNVEVHLLGYKSANTDTGFVMGVAYFEGIGDTNAGGNTSAITATTLHEDVVVIAASDIGAAPNVASVSLTPGAHADDAYYLMAAWIEYTRTD